MGRSRRAKPWSVPYILRDRLCLPPVEALQPEEIKKIREKSRVSQAVFAALLNTSVSTVQKWEIGQKRPTGTALKLLHLAK
ncbi:MAG: transcriptional regulator [Betaproteobacteria bacterium RIFCSPLOWO2_12_61_14]|nr:MAG: transcriptional regulator [Betaproteobacteria bacterium RIFCSPLOWO2_12_61_14]